MDLDAVLARRPQVALVDELAHTNVPGSRTREAVAGRRRAARRRHRRRSPPSTCSTSSRSTTWSSRSPASPSARPSPTPSSGPPTRSSWSTWTPEALRRRMAHGNIYAAEKVDAALGNYFRVGNLTALRELALLWVADRVDESLQGYLDDHGIGGPWETRERVVVAVTGAPGGEQLIRRAARMAARAQGRPPRRPRPRRRRARRPRPRELSSPPAAARGPRRHVPRGRRRRRRRRARPASPRPSGRPSSCSARAGGARWAELTAGLGDQPVIRAAGDIDVHVISHETRPRRARRRRRPVAVRRPLVRRAPPGRRLG